MNRTNEQWLQDLQSEGTARNEALNELQVILVNGLQRGLLSQVKTDSAEFQALAEDFAQEALIKVLDQIDSFAGLSKFTTWAHKIALHVALTELRRKRWGDFSLDGILETEEGEYTPRFTADETPTPAERAEQADLIQRVRDVIQFGLTEKQRMALIANVIEDKNASEVAELMDMKPNAVYKLLHDARLRLKRNLEQEGLSPEIVLAAFE